MVISSLTFPVVSQPCLSISVCIGLEKMEGRALLVPSLNMKNSGSPLALSQRSLTHSSEHREGQHRFRLTVRIWVGRSDLASPSRTFLPVRAPGSGGAGVWVASITWENSISFLSPTTLHLISSLTTLRRLFTLLTHLLNTFHVLGTVTHMGYSSAQDQHLPLWVFSSDGRKEQYSNKAVG